MDLEDFRKIDPHMLVGIVNTELRNSGNTLGDLCRTYDISEVEVRDHLAKGDYIYREEQNQFR